LNQDNFKSAMHKINASDELKEKTYQNVISKRNHYSFKKPTLILTTITIVLLCLLNLLHDTSINQSEYSFITIDINPSIEFILNKDNIVISSKAYNQEGKDILNELTYENKSYQEVINELLNNKHYQDYLKNNFDIQVSIYSKDTKRCEELENNIDELMKETSDTHYYQSVCIDEETHHQAKDCHVSSGKYTLIKDIIDIDSSYTINDLQKKSISELKEIYKDITNKDYIPNSNHHHHDDSHH
jgi:hypothetical protein